jgi:hypothetical protein
LKNVIQTAYSVDLIASDSTIFNKYPEFFPVTGKIAIDGLAADCHHRQRVSNPRDISGVTIKMA